jgi:hypothetical protein
MFPHRLHVRRLQDERGVALVTALLMIMLMSALLIGFTTAVTSDQRYRLVDRDRVRAFYAAHSGLEKLSTDLAQLFFVNVAPTDAQIDALGDEPPVIPDVEFNTDEDDENLRYGVARLADQPDPGPISTGPYQGLIALKQRYELNSTVRTTSGGEAHLKRGIETVAIPVFQFGMFSSMDLSFHAGPNFNFGGRVHSNGHLFLAQGDGGTLTLSDRVTAVGEVIRKRLANNTEIPESNHEGTVRVATAPGAYRNLATTEGSLQDSIGSAQNNPTWTNVSLSSYNGYIRNGRTGARTLNLPLVTFGGENTDLVRRPAVGEDAIPGGNPSLLAERYYSKVSLRILLSDTQADITSLPQLTATAPIQLAGNWLAAPPAGYGPVDATHPPVGRAVGWQTFTVTGDSDADGNSTVETSNNTTIVVNAVPGLFTQPNVTFTSPGGVTTVRNCANGKTLTSFIGCGARPAGHVNNAANWTASATIDGVVVSTRLLTWDAAANGGTATVDNTMQFVPQNSFWIDDSNTMITCTGYRPNGGVGPRFTGCNVPLPIAANTAMTTASRPNAGTSLVGGWIKIEKQDTDGNWTDVTLEILNHGFSGPNLGGRICDDPTPNAIIRLQRLRDNNEIAGMVAGLPANTDCSYESSRKPTDHVPNVLYDTREALYRDTAPAATQLRFAGIMHYVQIDADNLLNWFEANGAYAGGTGEGAFTDNGYAVYISDRRNNRNADAEETGELGAEDIINPGVDTGVGNTALDTGEDVNASAGIDRYGENPTWGGAYDAVFPCGTCGTYTANAVVTNTISPDEARVNPAIFFRRAIKLKEGGRAALNLTGARGLTISTENPVYVHGDWNFDADSYANPNLAHLATSIIADSVTVLSGDWNDLSSFSSPYATGGRVRSTSYYRFAVIAGKNMAFDPTFNGAVTDFGTDGGAHNFLRMLESGGSVVHYRGSIATFYYSRQAVGVYKCCTTVYAAPGSREFKFDTDFLNPSKLPPLTPMFRDLNALNFRQELRPGR